MSEEGRTLDSRLGWEPVEYPTAGQRFVQARYLRNQARREAKQHREHADYLRTDANGSAGDPDPDNVRFAGGEVAAAELWESVGALAQQEMDRWHDRAQAFVIAWGEDDGKATEPDITLTVGDWPDCGVGGYFCVALGIPEYYPDGPGPYRSPAFGEEQPLVISVASAPENRARFAIGSRWVLRPEGSR